MKRILQTIAILFLFAVAGKSQVYIDSTSTNIRQYIYNNAGRIIGHDTLKRITIRWRYNVCDTVSLGRDSIIHRYAYDDIDSFYVDGVWKFNGDTVVTVGGGASVDTAWNYHAYDDIDLGQHNITGVIGEDTVSNFNAMGLQLRDDATDKTYDVTADGAYCTDQEGADLWESLYNAKTAEVGREDLLAKMTPDSITIRDVGTGYVSKITPQEIRVQGTDYASISDGLLAASTADNDDYSYVHPNGIEVHRDVYTSDKFAEFNTYGAEFFDAANTYFVKLKSDSLFINNITNTNKTTVASNRIKINATTRPTLGNTDLLTRSENDARYLGTASIEDNITNGATTTASSENAVYDALALKQDNLVSATNIKTVNSTTLLGSGDLPVQSTLVSGTNIKTVNSTTLLGSGDLPVQATLVSGTNIKTVNSTSLLGSGDVAVQPTLVSATNIKTVNSTTLLGSGDLAVQPTLVSATNIKTINGSTILGSGDLTVAAGPAGSTTQVQYNNASSMAGASNVLIESNNLRLAETTAPTVSNAGEVLYSVLRGGVNELRGANRFSWDAAFMASPYDYQIASINPASNTSWTVLGMHSLVATGTATAAACASTSVHTDMKRLDLLQTGASTTNVAGWSESTGKNYARGNAAGIGGFAFKCKWSPATGVSTTTTRSFNGFSSLTSTPTDVEPSTYTQMCGFAWDAADTNIQFMSNDGSGSATKIDMGSNFAAPTVDRQEVYDMRMYCPQNGSTIYYYIKNLRTGNEVEGSTSTDLPTNTTYMAARGWISVGGTNSVIGYSVMNVELRKLN